MTTQITSRSMSRAGVRRGGGCRSRSSSLRCYRRTLTLCSETSRALSARWRR
uniref:Uncharacterized protein n=1 Tax=uncultured marine virus TaxID=186617 RepID=A0A0F7L983_9VIRU|nr:hypothetical protein [uncultured marine virus]